MYMPIAKKRDDTKIRNIKYLPKKITDKYRSDATIGKVLRDHKVTTIGELMRKLKSGR